jgi:hypothetical protein
MISLTVSSSRRDEVFGSNSRLKALPIPASLKASVREYLLYCYWLDCAANMRKVKMEAVQIKIHGNQHTDWRKPGYASLPACRRGRRRIEKQLGDLPRPHAGSDAYPGVS